MHACMHAQNMKHSPREQPWGHHGSSRANLGERAIKNKSMAQTCSYSNSRQIFHQSRQRRRLLSILVRSAFTEQRA